MTTSWHGYTFRMNDDPFWRESTGHRWIPSKRVRIVEPGIYFVVVSPNQLLNRQPSWLWFDTPCPHVNPQWCDYLLFPGEDYCQTEVMEASCGIQEVVVMTSAQYGRMQNGRCVRKDYGYIGCSADVLRLADVKCSGRHGCSIRVPDELFDITRPCPDDLKTYLEAHYTCIQGKRMGYDCSHVYNTILHITQHGPLTRYVKLRVAHAPGMSGTFCPPSTSREIASWRSRHALRHVRHARAVMHVGIANPRWREKRSRHFRRMRNL